MKFRKIPHLKYVGKRVLPKTLKNPSELRLKIWKNSYWFIIKRCNLYIFKNFLSNRALLRKYLLTVCFSPCYLNGKLRADSLFRTIKLDSLTIWNVFCYFLETIYVGKLTKKSIWEIKNALICIHIINREKYTAAAELDEILKIQIKTRGFLGSRITKW